MVRLLISSTGDLSIILNAVAQRKNPPSSLPYPGCPTEY